MMDINSVLGDRKKVWSIASSLILCVFAFVLLFKYDFGSFQKIKLAIADNKCNKATLDSLGEYKKYLKEFNVSLASGNDIEWLMGALVAASKNNGVILSVVKPFERERSSGYGIVKVSIEGKSSYQELLRFIEVLEDSKEYVFIESFSMHSIETGAGESAKSSSAALKERVPRGKLIGFNAIMATVVREI